jgi:hypothetical protein
MHRFEDFTFEEKQVEFILIPLRLLSFNMPKIRIHILVIYSKNEEGKVFVHARQF